MNSEHEIEETIYEVEFKYKGMLCAQDVYAISEHEAINRVLVANSISRFSKEVRKITAKKSDLK